MGLGTQEKPHAIPKPESLLSPDQQLALLERFAPRLRFDALERWRPGSAEAYLLGSAFLDKQGTVEPGTPPASAGIVKHFEELESQLNPLADGPGLDTQLRSNEMLAAYGDEHDLAGAGTCYGRVVHEDSSTLFLQYWLFYADNPCVLPPGRHDGDWELIQVRVRSARDEFEATHATVAGHGKPSTLSFNSTEGGPEVYVAVDSHASYFTPGAHPMLPLSDVSDPDSQGVAPAVTLMPVAQADWVLWRGRWGMDRGVGTWLALRFRREHTPPFLKKFKVGAGESPPSPGRQGASWSDPGSFQKKGESPARGLSLQVQRLAHFIGYYTWPRLMPIVRVERTAPDRFAVDAKPAGRLARRVSLVSVAFEELRPDGTRRGLAMYSVRSGQPGGPFTIPNEGEVRWRAAGYNRLRQRGEPTPAQEPARPPWPLKVNGTSADDRGARKVFEGALTGHLRRRGATTMPKIVGKAGWLWLRLSQSEVERVIEVSRRDGYVAPLGQERDAAGTPLANDEWALTDRGRELERTRSLSLRDSIVAIRGVGKPVASASEKWGKRVAAVLAPLVPFLAVPSGVSVSIAIVVAGVILALTANAGLRGELALRRAAERWPRLRTCRPRIHDWQTTAWHPWERVTIAGGAALYLVAAALILRLTDTWEFNAWIALALGAGLAALAWWRLGDAWRRWLSLNRAFRKERDRVKRLRVQTPNEPCVWGHVCRAAKSVDGDGVSCPHFGPGAPNEVERVPREL